MPSLCHIGVVLCNAVLAAKAAGYSSVLIPEKGFASRDTAPCSVLVRGGRYLRMARWGVFRVKHRALKARNVLSRVLECEEILHGKLDTHRHFVYAWSVVERGDGGVSKCVWPNKRLVLTMPARRSFSIRARHKSWVVVFASFCRSGRWHGRTSEALAVL